MSDYEWCQRNSISTSSFYYNVKRLRMAACTTTDTVTKVQEKQEVVPIHYNELPDADCIVPKYSNATPDIIVTQYPLNSPSLSKCSALSLSQRFPQNRNNELLYGSSSYVSLIIAIRPSMLRRMHMTRLVLSIL